MDFFVGPLCGLVKCLWAPLVRRIGYVKNLKENLEKLNKETQSLYTRRNDVQREINRDTVSKMPTSECEAWLKNVGEIEIQVNMIEPEIEANKRCLKGLCPDIFSRMKLGKRVMTLIPEITKLNEASAFKGGVLVDAPILEASLEIVERTAAPTIKGQTSSDRTVQKILSCIRDEEIRKIGLWGMGGVGKTTVMKILNNLPELTQMFQIVIWVTVSKDWSARKVQTEIANRLKLKLEYDDSNDSVARKLFHKFETMKYLLLLDDVWSMVNLEEVGVPEPSKDNGCKMVLTSRFRDICRKMGTDEEIKVEVLSKEEAWDLFHEKVGELVDSPGIQPLARSVVEECDGLPLAILAVGGSLRKMDDVHVWSNALDELKSATFEIGDMEELVFKRLKFSYERLKNESVKSCFLYCALYPEDDEINIPELIEHWRAEGLIDGVQNLNKAYDKGHAILNDLIDASLLERVVDEDVYVRMHDVIRDLALRLTSPKEKDITFLVRAGVGIEECSNEEEWEQATRISLMRNKLCCLPESPRCTLLASLLLQNNSQLKTIPESFFEHMDSLQVLNLSSTHIKVLPSSLSNLVNLRGLYLRDCVNLATLPSEVGALKTLEVLHLGNKVEYLPVEVKQLTRLRSLQVTFRKIYKQEKLRRRMLSEGVLPSLALLEDLRLCISRGGMSWRKHWQGIVDATIAEEVGSLKQVTSVEFNFPTIESLEHFVQRTSWKYQHSKSFHLSVGHQIVSSWDHFIRFEVGHNKHGHVRHLRWYGGDNIPSEIMDVLSQACCFNLDNHRTIKKLSDLGMENMNGLHFCYITNCDAIESIIDGNAALQNIQILTLIDLSKLRSIWEGPMPHQSFSALTYLHVQGCDKLSNVFSRGMFQHMSNLEGLFVCRCPKVEKIVEEEDDQDKDETVILPKLKSLELLVLPKLVRVCKAVSMPWPSLNRIVVYGCPDLKSLPFSSVVHNNASALSEIRGEREWWEELEWVDDDIKQKLQPLFIPRVFSPPHEICNVK